MRITSETRWKRKVAGYRDPDDTVTCANCGASAKMNRKKAEPWYCRRHKFFVNGRGACPKFSEQPYYPEERAEQVELPGADLFAGGGAPCATSK
mgnify:CR=1 FL=1